MKEIIISVTVAVSLVLIVMFFSGTLNIGSPPSRSGGDSGGQQGSVENVSMENGKQVIEITARGGYSPRVTTAKAGVATILRMKTAGTFDCSSALSIPSLGIRTSLPSSGTKDIDVPAQSAGSVLQGTCAMGMYNFQVQFR